LSHVTELDIEVKDLGALESACTALGLELVRDQQTYRWYGTSVGDTPLPHGFTEEDLGKCEHAIRIPGDTRAYEIGVVHRRDGREGYTLLWDSWAGGYGLVNKVGQEAVKLCDQYSAQVTMDQLRQDGFAVDMSVDQEGRITIDAQR
jgi:hypothetical protein